MRIRLGELRRLIQEAVEPEGAWYHLSFKDLGPEFNFTGRLPHDPVKDEKGNSIEDDFTVRTSWAPSIKIPWPIF